MEKVLTVDNFDEIVKEGVCLVDFWASWCGPCKMLAPNIEELANDYEGRVTVGKVNVDDHPSLAEKFGVFSIPTVILFENGEEKERIIGYHLKREYAQKLDSLLK